ncbi:MAG: ATP synthase subunit I [Clostridia bacterium]|nr:ATP synthase subunit I [Clostridia bacterium]
MNTQSVTVKETLKIAIGEIIVLILMFAVFALLGRFDSSVVFGGLLGAAANILYFIFICIGVNSAVKENDEKRQKQSLTISYYLRLIVLGVLIAVGLKLDCFHNIAVIVPVLMTRPILTAAEILGKGVKE